MSISNERAPAKKAKKAFTASSWTWHRVAKWTLLLALSGAAGWFGSASWGHQTQARAALRLLTTQPAPAVAIGAGGQSGEGKFTTEAKLGGVSFDLAQISERGELAAQFARLPDLLLKAPRAEVEAFMEAAIRQLVALEPQHLRKVLLFMFEEREIMDSVGQALIGRIDGEFTDRMEALFFQLANADPQRALLIAEVAPKRSEQEGLRSGVLASLATKEPERVLEMATAATAEIELGSGRNDVLTEAFRSLAARDLASAKNHFGALAHLEESARQAALKGMADVWAESDPVGLMAWAETADPAVRGEAMSTAIKQLQPTALKEWLAAHGDSVSQSRLQAYLAVEAIHQLSQHDKSAAILAMAKMPWSQETLNGSEFYDRINIQGKDALATVLSLPHSPIRDELLFRSLETTISSDKDEAIKTSASLSPEDRERLRPRLAEPENAALAEKLGLAELADPEALARLGGISDQEYRFHARQLYLQTEILDPEQATEALLERLKTLPASGELDRLATHHLGEVLKRQTFLSTDQAVQWVNSLPQSQARDIVLERLSNQENLLSVDRSALIQQISDPIRRQTAERRFAAKRAGFGG